MSAGDSSQYISDSVGGEIEVAVQLGVSEDGGDQEKNRDSLSPTEAPMGRRREDSCDVSIRLTRATPERMFRDEEEIEGQGEDGVGERDEVDGEAEIEKSLDLLPDRGTEFVYNSDNDDDSPTTGSSTSCNTPDPASLVGDLTPTNGVVTPVYSDPKLFQEPQHQKFLFREQERPASCPPPPVDHGENSSKNSAGDVKTESKEENEIQSISATSNHEGSAPADAVDGKAGPVTEPLDKQLQNGATDSGFDTLPELESLRETPQFKALGAREGGGEGEVVKFVISPNMVQVFSADGSKVILRRTIRSIVCCTQVYTLVAKLLCP